MPHLDDFIAVHREELLRRTRAKVAARTVPPPTEAEIDRGVPLFLDQLGDALRLALSARIETDGSTVLQGHDSLLEGLALSQVVFDYGAVCQSFTELAAETNTPFRAEDLRTLNRCLDEAVAGAAIRHGQQHHQLGFFVHELRNLIHTAMIAFEVLKSGNAGLGDVGGLGGLGGTTGTVLHRSLLGARDLIARSLAEIWLTNGVQRAEAFPVAGFIEELEPAASLAAHARGISLRVMPIDEDVAIEADRHVLAAVMVNILQNAFKFTRPRTTVTLRVRSVGDRVLIEVEDECGGLPVEDADALFRPFEQRSADRTGFGLGLAFSRWATEANHGRISARSLPGVGCVFTVDLARCPVPALART